MLTIYPIGDIWIGLEVEKAVPDQSMLMCASICVCQRASVD